MICGQHQVINFVMKLSCVYHFGILYKTISLRSIVYLYSRARPKSRENKDLEQRTLEEVKKMERS